MAGYLALLLVAFVGEAPMSRGTFQRRPSRLQPRRTRLQRVRARLPAIHPPSQDRTSKLGVVPTHGNETQLPWQIGVVPPWQTEVVSAYEDEPKLPWQVGVVPAVPAQEKETQIPHLIHQKELLLKSKSELLSSMAELNSRFEITQRIFTERTAITKGQTDELQGKLAKIQILSSEIQKQKALTDQQVQSSQQDDEDELEILKKQLQEAEAKFTDLKKKNDIVKNQLLHYNDTLAMVKNGSNPQLKHKLEPVKLALQYRDVRIAELRQELQKFMTPEGFQSKKTKVENTLQILKEKVEQGERRTHDMNITELKENLLEATEALDKQKRLQDTIAKLLKELKAGKEKINEDALLDSSSQTAHKESVPISQEKMITNLRKKLLDSKNALRQLENLTEIHTQQLQKDNERLRSLISSLTKERDQMKKSVMGAWQGLQGLAGDAQTTNSSELS